MDPFYVTIFGQALGFGGLAFNVLSYQQKKGRRIIELQIPGNILWGMHFLLLASPVACGLAMMAALRNVFTLMLSDKYLNHLMVASMIIVWLLFFALDGGILAVVPCVATTLFGLCVTFRDNSMLVRIIAFVTTAMWLAFNYYISSYAGVMNGIIVCTANIVGALRHEEAFAPFRRLYVMPVMYRVKGLSDRLQSVLPKFMKKVEIEANAED